MYRVDRNAHGGGLMIFIRNDICFHVITRFNIDMSSFRTESMLLKVKIGKPWFAIVGIYRTPNTVSQKASGNLNLEYYHRAWLMSKSIITPSYTQF